MKIVGINGFKRSGKGEVAASLSRQHPGFVYEVGFADKLKMLAALALGQRGGPRDLIASMDSFKENGELWCVDLDAELGWRRQVTGRQYLQNLGNEGRKLFGENFWIDMVLPFNPATDREIYCPDVYPDVDVLAITDLRYANEAQRIKDLGGVVWEVVRPDATSDGHASEQPLPRELVDEVIVNDGTLDHLDSQVMIAMVNTLC